MNTQISKHQRYKSIIRVLDNHPEVLTGKTEILAAKAALTSKDNRIEELITELVAPVSIVYGPKRETMAILRVKVKRMTGLGILIAQKHNDLKLLQSMKTYKGLAYKTTAYKLYENALQVADAIEQFAVDAVGFGFSEEEIEQFRSAVTSFGTTLIETGNQLNDRKVSRTEIKSLFMECNKILKENFDPFALFVSETHPEFYREYSLLRMGVNRKKASRNADPEQGEISGTVTDSATGKAVEGVTVTLKGYDLATTTDEDGYYIFSDLLIGIYRINCSCQGYHVPAEQTAEITSDTTTVDVDFSLEVVEGISAA